MDSKMSKRKLTYNKNEKSSFLKKQKVKAIIDKNSVPGNVMRYYCLMPSLKYLSAVKIITRLWSRADIEDEIIKLPSSPLGDIFNCFCMDNVCQGVESKILNRISQLSGFDDIRTILADIVNPIVQEIFDWMKYHNTHVFFNDYYPDSQQHFAVNYLDSLVWASRGLIDYKETARVLLAKDELSNGYKYNIACYYCFEDEIKILAPQVLPILSLESITAQPMLCFWTSYLGENFAELQEELEKELSIYENYSVEEIKKDLIGVEAELKQNLYNYNKDRRTNYSINEYMFQILICSSPSHNHAKNQVAVKYIWDKLNGEEKSRNITAVRASNNPDLECFFLSQMNEEQQQQIFQNSACILLSFIDSLLWKDYFLSTIHHIWNIMTKRDYLLVLRYIVHHICEHYEDNVKHNRYKAIFKEIWQSTPEHLKEYLFKYNDGLNGISIFLFLLHKKNLDIIQLLLPDINDIQKRKIMFSSIDRKWYHLIITDQFDVLEMLIKNSLFLNEDIYLFKQRLVLDKGYHIAVHFMLNQALDKVEQFIQWAFKSEEEIRKFKLRLAYTEICDNILKTIIASNKADFEELENHIKWCASNRQNIIDNLKLGIPKEYSIINQLIIEDKYQLLEQFLNWCFLNDQVKRFKQNFCQIHEADEIVNLVVDLIVQDNQLKSLEKFVNWCFVCREEIKKFKEFILQPAKDTLGVCIKLLCCNMFKLADEFVNWGCNASQIDISNFKNKLMLYDDINYLFKKGDPKKSKLYATKVIHWFNPSLGTITKFREKFINVAGSCNFLFVLDNYLQDMENNLYQNIENDVNNVLQDLLLDVENKDNNIIND